MFLTFISDQAGRLKAMVIREETALKRSTEHQGVFTFTRGLLGDYICELKALWRVRALEHCSKVHSKTCIESAAISFNTIPLATRLDSSSHLDFFSLHSSAQAVSLVFSRNEIVVPHWAITLSCWHFERSPLCHSRWKIICSFITIHNG